LRSTPDGFQPTGPTRPTSPDQGGAGTRFNDRDFRVARARHRDAFEPANRPQWTIRPRRR